LLVINTRIMDKFYIKGTAETPTVSFDSTGNTFEISGKSLPEDVKEFYHPIIKWLTEYCQSPNDVTTLKVRMEYFNTASSKMILELFELLNKLHLSGRNAAIEWYYQEDDEDMMDAGNDYADMLDLPFKIFGYQTLLK